MNMPSKTKQELIQDIEQVLDSLREGIAMHSGDVELVDFDEKTSKVMVRFKGACIGCPMADMTLKAGIEETLMQVIPEVKEVVAVNSDNE